MVNIGVGPSNAKNITDHVAVLRPHAWMMLGHCAGLRNSQQLGDYVHDMLPMRYEEKHRMAPSPVLDTRGERWQDRRTREGELLAPRQFPEEAVARMEASRGSTSLARMSHGCTTRVTATAAVASKTSASWMSKRACYGVLQPTIARSSSTAYLRMR